MNSLVLRALGGLTSISVIGLVALTTPGTSDAVGAPSVFVETVPPAPLLLVCPGAAVEIGGEDGTNFDSIERLGTADLAVHQGDPAVSATFFPDSLIAETMQAESWTAIELRDSQLEQNTDLLAAAQYQVVSNARNRGLLAANCTQPALQQHFVGGSLAEGHETLLVLANPGANESGVNVRLITDTGSTDESYSVPGSSERIIALSALGDGESSIAVEVTSTQPIGAWLQHRASAGLEPLGISWVSRQPSALEVLNIFGLVVRGNADAPAVDLVTPSVRVFNPGSNDIEALVEVTGIENFGTVVRLNIPAGRVREVAIDGLADGEYSVRITAGAEIHAAVRSPVVVSSGATDFDWLAATESVETELRFPAQPVKGTLIVFNPGSSEVELIVEATRSAGATLTTRLNLAPLEQTIIEVEAGRSALISAPEGNSIQANLRYLNGNGIAYWQPSLNQNPGSEISVSVR